LNDLVPFPKHAAGGTNAEAINQFDFTSTRPSAKSPSLGNSANAKQIIGPADGVNGPRPEVARDDFESRHEHIALLEQLKQLPDGTRVRVKVTHGLSGGQAATRPHSIGIARLAPTGPCGPSVFQAAVQVVARATALRLAVSASRSSRRLPRRKRSSDRRRFRA
jgi:hypothetical protein